MPHESDTVNLINTSLYSSVQAGMHCELIVEAQVAALCLAQLGRYLRSEMTSQEVPSKDVGIILTKNAYPSLPLIFVCMSGIIFIIAASVVYTPPI